MTQHARHTVCDSTNFLIESDGILRAGCDLDVGAMDFEGSQKAEKDLQAGS